MKKTELNIGNIKITRYHYGSISSTQDKAEEITKTLPDTGKDWLLVTADTQTKGRGTHNRTWISPPDVNIYATFVFPFPKESLDLITNIPQVTAYSVVLTLQKFGFKPTLKWINDVLLDRKKVCGILSQSEFPTHFKEHLAIKVGIGININMNAEMCNSVDQPVTSLLVSSGKTFDRELILNCFQEIFQKNISLLIQNGFAHFSSNIAEKMEFLNESIKLKNDRNDSIVEGIMKGVDAEGALLLETKTATGTTIQKFITGHILTKEEAISLSYCQRTAWT